MNKFCFFICFFQDFANICLMKRKTIRNHKDFKTSLGDYKVNSYNMTVKAKSAKIPGDARYG